MKLIILIAFATVMVSTAICAPSVMINNSFVAGLFSFEILNVLAVILTVTLASVANIHLSLNRVIRGLFEKNLELGIKKGDIVRREINQNAWLLVWLFIGSCAVLFLKGAISDGASIEALLNGAIATILLANILVLYDIYSVVYKLVAAESKIP